MKQLAMVGCPDPREAFAFANNPWNEGMTPDLTAKDRDRHAIVCSDLAETLTIAEMLTAQGCG